ncbi:MAG TPA: hypothetical protein GXX75_24855 [Clostridiales bacterium]|nr:hypothetical protein [Clostridiales bacterium]
MKFQKEAIQYQLLSGKTADLPHQRLIINQEKERMEEIVFQEAGYTFHIRDGITVINRQETLVTRHIIGKRSHDFQPQGDGIQFSYKIALDLDGKGLYRFCLPSIHYTAAERLSDDKLVTFMEDRLTANIAAIYHVEEKKAYSLTKRIPAVMTTNPQRMRGESSFLHKTDLCSMGYEQKNNQLKFVMFWPYYEGDKSVAIDSKGTPVSAFYPLDGDEIDITFEYLVEQRESDNFTESIYQPFQKLSEFLDAGNHRIVSLPFSPEESIEYRLNSLEQCYREFEDEGAGLFFHFDPRKGYGSLPSGFGTSFNTIPHDSYVHILEYGFTGRQVNAVLLLAQSRRGLWMERGVKVINFFLKHCMTKTGWLYTLYDLNTKAPFYSFGDPQAPKLHYISRTCDKGNYLRTMVEAMNDVLEAYQWYRANGELHEEWLKHVMSFADFLLAKQNGDGSWYRAYQPDGTAAVIAGEEGLTATVLPLIFMCNLCRELEIQGRKFQHYKKAAISCGLYTISNSTMLEHYQGGTLDNPNIVDKEAAQYTMAGLYHLYRLTDDTRYLHEAVKAAKLFVTWNYIWNAPTQHETYLHGKGFRTKGFGGINSIWGGGVVDIYSLFHIKELYQIGIETKQDFFCRMAEWIGIGTEQILSCPMDSMTFADIGMQPEGFGICNQGIDEGMIAKGDIWGTLGWVYSAGIYGLGRYLEEKNKKN